MKERFIDGAAREETTRNRNHSTWDSVAGPYPNFGMILDIPGRDSGAFAARGCVM
jgi:hypothetical protein